MEYAVTYDAQTIGCAKIKREGLCARIECRCTLPDSDRYEIEMLTGKSTHCLGLCVPYGKEFGLQKTVPLRFVEGADPVFRVLRRKESREELIEVLTGRPFAPLHRLRGARLVHIDGKAFIRLQECSAPVPPGSDQNP